MTDPEVFMKKKTAIKRLIALLLSSILWMALLPYASASAKTVAQYLEGYRTGKDYWFGGNFAYDITDTDAVWALITRPITVLDSDYEVYPLVEPGGKKVNHDKLGGFINTKSSAVNVLGEDENGWTLIEGMDYYNRIIKGYVKTNLLKVVTPNQHVGFVIDKLTQTLYAFIDGAFFSSCLVSTGLPNDSQPYNESSAGEYLIWSRTGMFNAEGMYCDMALRYNGGDLLHEVPHNINADGSRNYSRFEPLLGQKASHGCIRIARAANADGLNMKWLWDNLKSDILSGDYPKVVIWDDAGRKVSYPSDDTVLYYNPTGGQNYHSDEYCNAVKDRYLPLTAFTYGELDDETYASLTPCPYCTNILRKDVIDLDNLQRGAITQQEYDALQAERHGTAPVEETTAPDSSSGSAASVEDIIITITTVDN